MYLYFVALAIGIGNSYNIHVYHRYFRCLIPASLLMCWCPVSESHRNTYSLEFASTVKYYKLN